MLVQSTVWRLQMALSAILGSAAILTPALTSHTPKLAQRSD